MVEYLSGDRIQGSSAPDINTSDTPTQDFDFSSQGSWDLNIEGSSSHWDLDNSRLNFETKGASSGSGAHFDLTSVPDKWILRFKVRIDSSQTGYVSAGQGDGLILIGLQSHDTESGNTASSPNTSNQQAYSEDHEQAQLIILFKSNATEGSGRYSFQGKFVSDSNAKQCSSSTSPSCNPVFNNDNIYDDTDYYVEIKKTGTTCQISYGTNSDYTTGRTVGTATGVSGLDGLRYIHVEGVAQNVTYDSYGGGYIDDMKYWATVDEKDAITNVELGTRYEETDTRKIYTRKYATGAFTPSWVERGTEGSMTATLWSCADTSAMYAGGTTSAWTANNTTQTWNGSSWSGASNLSASRELLDGGGNATDYISVGGDSGGAGSPQDDVYKWDGSSWSSGGTTSSNTFMLSAGGDTTDALWCGGNNGSGAISTAQTYDGSSWTAISSMSDARRGHAGDGTSSDFLAVGGYDDGSSTQRTAIEAWNGTSWSAGTAYNGSNGDMYGYGGGAGRTSSFIAQSNQRSQSNTYTYNGSAWALTNNSTGGSVNYSGVGGDSGNAIKAGGSSSSSWAINTSEKFNGTNWTATNNLNTGISTGGMGGNN